LSQVAAGGRSVAATRGFYNRGMPPSALILFAHGARDPRWAEPFERVLEAVKSRAPGRAPMLAFLELMDPDLSTAIATQVGRGFASIRVVPLFLGPGGHLRDDLPAIIDAARQRHAGVTIDVAKPAGEDPGVIEALARYALG
jgi:sirohydrochlorin cobaltochelatase